MADDNAGRVLDLLHRYVSSGSLDPSSLDDAAREIVALLAPAHPVTALPEGVAERVQRAITWAEGQGFTDTGWPLHVADLRALLAAARGSEPEGGECDDALTEDECPKCFPPPATPPVPLDREAANEQREALIQAIRGIPWRGRPEMAFAVNNAAPTVAVTVLRHLRSAARPQLDPDALRPVVVGVIRKAHGDAAEDVCCTVPERYADAILAALAPLLGTETTGGAK